MAKVIKSKRKYPERNCMNTECNFGSVFVPHDKRQAFCSAQCRSNYNNDKRAHLNNTVFLNEKTLRSYQKKLGRLFNHFKKNKDYSVVHSDFLNYEGVNPQLLTSEQQNVTTGGKTRWIYEYGLEQHPSSPEYYIIHYRKTIS